MTTPKRWLIATLIGVLIAGCGGDNPSPTPDRQHTVISGPADGTPTPGQPGYVGSPQTEPGRSAPDVTSGPLTFTQVRVYASPASGNYLVRANVMNTGAEFLNGARIRWNILDASGQPVDTDESVVATLAPGETTTVHLEGTVPHSEDWSSVTFAFTGAD